MNKFDFGHGFLGWSLYLNMVVVPSMFVGLFARAHADIIAYDKNTGEIRAYIPGMTKADVPEDPYSGILDVDTRVRGMNLSEYSVLEGRLTPKPRLVIMGDTRPISSTDTSLREIKVRLIDGAGQYVSSATDTVYARLFSFEVPAGFVSDTRVIPICTTGSLVGTEATFVDGAASLFVKANDCHGRMTLEVFMRNVMSTSVELTFIEVK